MESWLQSKMQNEADLEGGRPEVVEQLALGRLGRFDTRLGFDDEALIDDHVNSLDSNDVLLI